jgi:uncharacterized membrane protein (UPF0127 family)
MRFAIDVVLMDETGRVLEVVEQLQPGAPPHPIPRDAVLAVELAGGEARRLEMTPGARQEGFSLDRILGEGTGSSS